jgi:putative FmdB family regulatory protein
VPARPVSTRSAPAVPTYQYACTNDAGKHEFEVVQSFTDAPVSECPQCGSRVRKVYGSVGVVFKGSGFYRTDSRNGSKSGDRAESGASEKKSGTDTKSTDKEPAGAGSTTASSSGNGKQPASGGSSTGQKAAVS